MTSSLEKERKSLLTQLRLELYSNVEVLLYDRFNGVIYKEILPKLIRDRMVDFFRIYIDKYHNDDWIKQKHSGRINWDIKNDIIKISKVYTISDKEPK